MTWFNREKITVEDPIEDIYGLRYHLSENFTIGASNEGASNEEVGTEATEYLAWLDEFINQEETLKAKASFRLPREIAPEKKRK
jgi:hypothetical protein